MGDIQHIAEVAADASTDAVRDRILQVPAEVRPFVVQMLSDATYATMYAVAETVYEEGYIDGNGDGGIMVFDLNNPYKKESE